MRATTTRAVTSVSVAVVAVCVVLLVRVITDDKWNATQWSALAAAAAAVQTVGVVGALLYARRQINTSRDLARRERLNELLDRVVDQYYSEVAPTLRNVLLHYDHIESFLKVRELRVSQGLDTTPMDHTLERTESDLDALVRALNAGCEELHLRAQRLGLRVPKAHLELPWFPNIVADLPTVETFQVVQRSHMTRTLVDPLEVTRQKLADLVREHAPFSED